MDILGYLLLAVGLFVAYSAFKGHAPWEMFKAQIPVAK